MATIVNDRNARLQAESPRYAVDTTKVLLLTSSTPVFKVVSGSPSPSSATLTAQPVSLTTVATWSITGGTLTGGADNVRTLAYSDMSGNTAVITAQVIENGVTYLASTIIAKVTDGATGADGADGADAYSNALVYAYKRASSAPSDNPGGVTYTFASGSITTPSTDALSNGWTKSIPAGTDALYVTAASASAISATDTISSGEWATPVLFVANGLNAATVHIYQRNTTNTAPTLPSATTTYTFSTSALTGLNNGWTTTVPTSGGDYLFTSTATAVATSSTDTIASGEWAAAALMAKNGADGADGADGSNGIRGTVTLAISGYSSWNDASASYEVLVATGTAPIDRDIVTLYDSTHSTTKFYQSGTWYTLTAYINGNMIVSGTFSAGQIYGGTLDGVVLEVGSGHTPASRAFEVNSSGVCYLDYLFSYGYISSTNGTTWGSIPALTAVTVNSAVGIWGVTASGNADSGAHAIRGTNVHASTGGIVGGQNGYAFYAESGTAGPFTGSHDVLVANGVTIEPGDIVVDVSCVSRQGLSNTIFEVETSSSPGQTNAFGVLVHILGPLADSVPAVFIGDFVIPTFQRGTTADYEEFKGLYQAGSANALGEGQINVCGEGGGITAGDYIITSSIPGKGMRQSDGVLRNSTVAKARESVVFSSPSEIKQIACFYVAG